MTPKPVMAIIFCYQCRQWRPHTRSFLRWKCSVCYPKNHRRKPKYAQMQRNKY